MPQFEQLLSNLYNIQKKHVFLKENIYSHIDNTLFGDEYMLGLRYYGLLTVRIKKIKKIKNNNVNVFLLLENKNKEYKKEIGFIFSLNEEDLNFEELYDFINNNIAKDIANKELLFEYIKINIQRLFNPNKYKYPYTENEKKDHIYWIESIPF